MNSHEPYLRRLLSAADNAQVSAAEADAALDRALRGLVPRCRLEVAASRVYLGPIDSSVPSLEALPLRPTTVGRALGFLRDRRVSTPAASSASAARPRLSLVPRLELPRLEVPRLELRSAEAAARGTSVTRSA